MIIHLEYDLPVAPTVVWDALTTPEALRRWWRHGVVLEPREGGAFREPWTDDSGQPQVTSGQVRACILPRYLLLSWQDSDWPYSTEVEFSILPERMGCRLTLEHRGWITAFPDAERRRQMVQAHRSGWEQHMRALGRYCSAFVQGG